MFELLPVVLLLFFNYFFVFIFPLVVCSIVFVVRSHRLAYLKEKKGRG